MRQMKAMPKQLRLSLVSVLCALICVLVMPIPSAFAAGTGALNLEILSSEGLAERPYVFVRAAMSGNLTRPDGSTGAFKVPVWLVYPKTESRCNGVGVVEGIHTGRLPAFLNQLSDAEEGDRNSLAWPTLAAGASLFGQE